MNRRTFISRCAQAVAGVLCVSEVVKPKNTTATYSPSSSPSISSQSPLSFQSITSNGETTYCEYVDGRLVRKTVYSRALSEDEIMSLYNEPFAMCTETKLLG